MVQTTKTGVSLLQPRPVRTRRGLCRTLTSNLSTRELLREPQESEDRLKTTDFASKGLYRSTSQRGSRLRLFEKFRREVANWDKNVVGLPGATALPPGPRTDTVQYAGSKKMDFDPKHLDSFLRGSSYGEAGSVQCPPAPEMSLGRQQLQALFGSMHQRARSGYGQASRRPQLPMTRPVENSLYHQDGMPPLLNGNELFSLPGQPQTTQNYASNFGQRLPDVFRLGTAPSTGQRALPLLLQPHQRLRGAVPQKKAGLGAPS